MNLLNIINIVLLFISFINCYNVDTVICEYDSIDQETSFERNSYVNILCNDSTCYVNGESASFSDRIITINEQGTFVVEGTLNGQLVVEADEEAIVHIIFNNVIINNNVGPALVIAAADKVSLTLVNENTLRNSLKNLSDNTVILSNSNLSINGVGSLKLENTYGELINCNKDLKLVTGEIIINSSDINKIQAKNSFCIKDTVFKLLNSTSSKTIPSSLLTTSTTTTTISIPPTKTTTGPAKSPPTSAGGSGGSGGTTKAITTVPRKDTQPTNSSCSNTIQRMGYKCCRSNCRIIYVDRYGNWGSENNKWCGCGGGPKCSQIIMNKGYRCCQSDNCSIKYDDIDGEWGVDQNTKKWCGIRYSCHDKKRK